jgi:hypothetical protein
MNEGHLNQIKIQKLDALQMMKPIKINKLIKFHDFLKIFRKKIINTLFLTKECSKPLKVPY